VLVTDRSNEADGASLLERAAARRRAARERTEDGHPSAAEEAGREEATASPTARTPDAAPATDAPSPAPTAKAAKARAETSTATRSPEPEPPAAEAATVRARAASGATEPTPSAPPATRASISNARAGLRTDSGPGSMPLIDLAPLEAAGYVSPTNADTKLAHEYRRIKRPLLVDAMRAEADDVLPKNVILVTSSIAGEGKSFVALNLALSIATEVDFTVLLVDADNQGTGLTQRLGVERSPGLSDLLSGRQTGVASILRPTTQRNLRFISADAHDPHMDELVASEAMRNMMREIATRYADRIVIIDAGPLLHASEPNVLARLAGQVLFVVQADKTSEASVVSALGMLPDPDAVSLVLNKASTRTLEGGYYRYGRAENAGDGVA
jgi:receptor protein-tyrosine kinase